MNKFPYREFLNYTVGGSETAIYLQVTPSVLATGVFYFLVLQGVGLDRTRN
jgi:hypothetical protein